MNRAVRTTTPLRVTSLTSTTPRRVTTSTRRPARVAATSSVVVSLPPASMTISTRPPFIAAAGYQAAKATADLAHTFLLPQGHPPQISGSALAAAEGRQGPARGGKAGAGSRREGRGRLARPRLPAPQQRARGPAGGAVLDGQRAAAAH